MTYEDQIKLKSLGQVKVFKYLNHTIEYIKFKASCLRQIEELETDSLELFRAVMQESKAIKKVHFVRPFYEYIKEITAILNSISTPLEELKISCKEGYCFLSLIDLGIQQWNVLNLDI